MTRRTRKVLFYCAVAIFLSASYIAILYAQGYRYSFADNNFFKTGSIFLKSNISADVYLENELIGTTSFIGNSFAINHLLPGKYNVALAGKDIFPWQKSIFVEEGYVSEFSKILLLDLSESGYKAVVSELGALFTPSPTPTASPRISPKISPSPTPRSDAPIKLKNGILTLSQGDLDIADDVVGFTLSDGNEKAAWWNRQNEVWVLWLDDSNYQPIRGNGDFEMITKLPRIPREVRWFRGDDHLAVKFSPIGNSASPSYQIIETDKRGGLNIITIQ